MVGAGGISAGKRNLQNDNNVSVNHSYSALNPLTNAARLLIVSSWKAGVLVGYVGLVAAPTRATAILGGINSATY